MANGSKLVLSPDEMREAFILTREDLWAETYLRSPMDPQKPLTLRKYQRRVLMDKHYRQLLRMGRRTGKSAILAIRALYRSFTNSNRQVLLTAAYETQIDNIFDLIRRMAMDSPLLAPSVKGYRRKPYELWWKNDSVIKGRVANSSIRGQCLVAGTQVLMPNLSWKPIENVVTGDEVCVTDDMYYGYSKSVVTNVFESGVKPVFELRTKSARRLIASADHPVYAMGKGWTPISELNTYEKNGSKADFIVVLDILGARRWSRVATVSPYGTQPTYDIEVKDYHHFIAFYPNTLQESGFLESGFNNGGILVHNSADDVIIDETDYIPEDTLLEDIWPICTTFKHTSVTMSSTPSGRRQFFWKVSTNRNLPEFNFHEYHIRSAESPEWTPEQEKFIIRTTTRMQYEHEYEAEFGEAVDGVFRHKDIDSGLFVYNPNDLDYNPKNYYVLGTDWNQPKNGVHVVILEWMNEGEYMIPYKEGSWVTPSGGDPEKNFVSRKLRLFRHFIIDPLEYINTKAVDFILKKMGEIPINYAVFDHGHGHTNWELLRLAISNGKSPTGRTIAGLSHMMDRMETLDFGSKITTEDPQDPGKQLQHKAKNFIVELANAALMNNMFIIPAVDEKDNPMENDEMGLVNQMRDYNVKRNTDTGTIYEAGPSGDHALDAFMMAAYAYAVNHADFMNFQSNTSGAFAQNTIVPVGVRKRLLETGAPAPAGYKRTRGGILVTDHGNWSRKGEPPERDDSAQTNALLPARKRRSTRSTGFTRSGDRSI